MSTGAADELFQLLKSKRYAEALKMGIDALRTDPKNNLLSVRVAQAAVAERELRRAQNILLQLVKREERPEYFGLLGEVLIRRGDYDRSSAILKHAIALGGGPLVEELLEVSRSRGQLPDSVTLVPGAGSKSGPKLPPPFEGGGAPAPPPPRRESTAALDLSDLEMEEEAGASSPPPPAIPGPPPKPSAPMFPSAPAPKADAVFPATLEPQAEPIATPYLKPREPSGREIIAQRSVREASVPDPLAEFVAKEQGGAKVMPRLLGPDKPKDAASLPLRRAAAVGHHYIGELLASGLVEIPSIGGMQSRTGSDVKKHKSKWGVTAERYLAFFIGLFLVVGAMSAGWWVYRGKKRQAIAESRVSSALGTATDGSIKSLREAHELVNSAVKIDEERPKTILAYAEVEAAMLVLYGLKEGVGLPTRMKKLEGKYKPGDKGYNRWLFAASVKELVAPQSEASNLVAQIDSLPQEESSSWVRWVRVQLLMRLEKWKEVESSLELATVAPETDPLLWIAKGDLLSDQGKLVAALAAYDRVLKAYPRHPLALIGYSMATNEIGVTEPAETMERLTHELMKDLKRVDKEEYGNLGSRGTSYREIALASTSMLSEYFSEASESLKKVSDDVDARIRGLAILQYLRTGNRERAFELYKGLPKWFASGPLGKRVTGAVHIENGRPLDALEVLGEDGVADRMLRGRALMLQSKFKDAAAIFSAVADKHTMDIEFGAWKWAAIGSHSSGEESLSELRTLARSMKSHRGRYLYASVLFQRNELGDAQRQLRRSLEDISPAEPAPDDARSNVLLAAVALDLEDIAEAKRYIKAAKRQNPDFAPISGIEGRLAFHGGSTATAKKRLQIVIDAGSAGIGDYVVWAKLHSSQLSVARKALATAATMGAPNELLIEVAESIDPELALEFARGN